MFHTAKSFAHESMSHLGSIFSFIAFVFGIGLKLHIYFFLALPQGITWVHLQFSLFWCLCSPFSSHQQFACYVSELRVQVKAYMVGSWLRNTSSSIYSLRRGFRRCWWRKQRNSSGRTTRLRRSSKTLLKIMSESNTLYTLIFWLVKSFELLSFSGEFAMFILAHSLSLYNILYMKKCWNQLPGVVKMTNSFWG